MSIETLIARAEDADRQNAEAERVSLGPVTRALSRPSGLFQLKDEVDCEIIVGCICPCWPTFRYVTCEPGCTTYHTDKCMAANSWPD